MEIRNTFRQFFFIKKHRKNSAGYVPIYLRMKVNGKSIDLSTHRTVLEKNWNTATGIIKGSTKEVKRLNRELFAIKSAVYEHYRHLRESSSNVTVKEVKNSYLGIVEDNRKKLIEVFQEQNDETAKREGIDITKETVKRYNTSLLRLQEYIKITYGTEDIYLEEINKSFATSYEIYLKTEIKLGHNTAIKHLKHLKKIINIARSNGWMTVNPFEGIKLSEKKFDRGFLSDEELKVLIGKEFATQRLSEVRDCFIFSCFSGLAYVDLSLLTHENIVIGSDGQKWVKINRKKTGNKSSIPILGVTKTILDKYANHPYCIKENKLLPVKTNQKMNEYLKEIAILCEIDRKLTTHLARHTFATTVTLNNDVPLETVSKMLGHSSLKTTKIYARLLDKKVGRDMSKLNAIY